METDGSAASRVQSIVQSGVQRIPPQYIQSPQNRPYTHHSKPTQDRALPLIDLSGFDSENRVCVRDAVAQACAEWGAFHVVNHGVPAQLLDDIISAGRSFFDDSPTEDKLKYACDPSSAASQGYGTKMLVSSSQSDTVLDWRDYFDHHTFPLSRRDPSRWPQFPPNYRKIVASYSDEMRELALKLMGLISESLGMQPHRIEDAVGELYQNITVSYYPPCPQPDLTLGLQSHSDMGAITLLIQDQVGGLEVYKDSEWIMVQPVSNAILVILADQMEVITNGKYKSAVHRAITNPTSSRLSVATFHDPAKVMKISPASELIIDSSPARYRDVDYGEYVSSWCIPRVQKVNGISMHSSSLIKNVPFVCLPHLVKHLDWWCT